MDNQPQPKPVDPKPATNQAAHESQPQAKPVDPKSNASPRLVKYSEDKYSEDLPPIRFDCGDE